MKLFRQLFFILCFVFGATNGAQSAISEECASHTDCDEIMACELFTEIENAAAGLTTDYNRAVANVARQIDACKNYPDKFQNNISVNVSKSPNITVKIDWDIVRNKIIHGNYDDLNSTDKEIIELIVGILGPDEPAHEQFFTDLAKAYLSANKNDDSARLDTAFVLNFLSEEDFFYKHRLAVRDLTGQSVNEDYGIDVDWDEVISEISNILDQIERYRGALVCENNRSYQVGIDVAGWVITAVAAIATFYVGGAGGAAAATGKAALGTLLKKSAKTAVNRAGRKLIVSATKQIGVQAAKKGLIKAGARQFVKQVGANLLKKQTALLAAGSALWMLGKNRTTTSSKLYSLVNSKLDKSFLNCHDLDHNEGCYTVCGDGAGDDYINEYALYPVLKKRYCVNPDDYALYEINQDGTMGPLLMYKPDQHAAIKNNLIQHVQDKGSWGAFKTGKGCDWNEDDIDMYFGFYIYDPDTFEVSKETMVIDDAIRLDD